MDFDLIVQLFIDFLFLSAGVDAFDAVLHGSIDIKDKFGIGECAVQALYLFKTESDALICKGRE